VFALVCAALQSFHLVQRVGLGTRVLAGLLRDAAWPWRELRHRLPLAIPHLFE